MKSVAAAVFLGLLVGIAVIQMVRTDAATSVQEKAIKKASDEYLGPIVDYDRDFQTAALANPKERALREARGQRYNQRAPDPLGNLPSNWVGFATGTDWYIGVPALPLARSDAVIVGDVSASEAHISNDRTGVYSEFSIRITEVLKNHLDTPLNVDDVTVGEREGGVVRFQDGRLFEFTVFHQGMPRLGRKYLFFLSRNKEGEDYTIVTAYELRQGQVFPLDDSKAFNSFHGTDQQDFLNRVRAETARRRSQPENERRSGNEVDSFLLAHCYDRRILLMAISLSRRSVAARRLPSHPCAVPCSHDKRHVAAGFNS